MTQLGVSYLFPDYVAVANGWQDTVRPPTPPASTDFIFTVPGDFFAVLLVARYTVNVNGAGKTSETPGFEITDQDGVIIVQVLGTTAVAFGATADQEWLPNIAQGYASGNNNYIPMPQFVIPPGWTIRSAHQFNGAGSQITNPRLTMQKFSTGPRASYPQTPAGTPVAAVDAAPMTAAQIQSAPTSSSTSSTSSAAPAPTSSSTAPASSSGGTTQPAPTTGGIGGGIGSKAE